jgi:endonuclease/exonuclease/phosphatase family metal-dependent hydrolase
MGQISPHRVTEDLSIVLWNVMWASRASRRGTFFVQRLSELSGQVICLTEGHADILPAGGHVVASEPDYGYPIRPGRRKVLLWSRNPWRDVDSLGSSELPSGRFVAATTDTPCGPVRFIGVCIPWRDAHVRSGQRNRQAWEDHLTYLQSLRLILRKDAGIPTVLLGDFNQRIPRRRQPQDVFDALTAALSPDFRIATTGLFRGAPSHAIDHLALRGSLESVQIECLDRRDSIGAAMSDHFGLRIVLQGGAAVS